MPHPAVYPLPPNVEGVPTQEELDALPRMFTWEELKDIIGRCDLIALKRNPVMQKRYDAWNVELKKVHHTVERYLLDVRMPPSFTHPSSPHLPPTSSRPLTPAPSQPQSGSTTPTPKHSHLHLLANSSIDLKHGQLDPEAEEEEVYVRFEDLDVGDLGTGEKGMVLLPNDWPYNTPYGVRHSILWTRKPIFHKALVSYSPSKWHHIAQEGISGFTGQPKYNSEGEEVERVGGVEDWWTEGGGEMSRIVGELWGGEEFECAWFVNPPRLQSVRGLSHAHIFARPKSEEEKERNKRS